MPRAENLLYRLVKDENSATELLCNLMSNSPFRRSLLFSLFGTRLAAQATYDQIGTQFDLGGRGCADLSVCTKSFCGILEVKATPWRTLTERQERDYLMFLSEQHQPHKCLAFLVPGDWDGRRDLDALLREARLSTPSVKSHIMHWGEVLDIIESKSLHKRDPLFQQAHGLLASMFRPAPARMTPSEGTMLFNKKTPTALGGLNSILLAFQKQAARAYKFKPSSRQRGLWLDEEFGLYFKNKSGKQVLWFGIWMAFWKDRGLPLCFGVDNTWHPAVRRVFRKAYAGQTYQFENWTLGALSREILADDAPVDAIWEELRPIIEAVTRTSSEKP